LPFFHNRAGFLGETLGGWEISGITRAQSGGPLTIQGSQSIGKSGSGVTNFTRRADLVPGVPLYSGFTCPANKECYINPAAFVVPPTGTAGNSGVGSIVGPHYQAWDFSLRKAFKLPREGMSFMLQADAFNAFNHTNWANPGTTVGGGFGQIGASQPPRQVQFGAKFRF